MARVFTYNIATDTLNGVVSKAALIEEINNDSSVDKNTNHIVTAGNTLLVTMEDDLSGAEETALDAVVAAHAGIDPEEGGVSLENAESKSYTNSYDFQLKCSLDAPVLYAGYPYRIGWYCEVNNSSTSGRTEVEVAYDGNVVAQPSIESEDTDDWVPFSGFYHVPADIPITQITLKFRRQEGYKATAGIRRARLEIVKVEE